MDGVIVIVVSVVLYIVYLPSRGAEVHEPVQKRVELDPRLNPSMIHDEHAFMIIANELGFH